MPRINFSKNNQSKFLNNIREALNIGWPFLAKLLGISNRTLFDWRREKNKINEVALNKCLELTNNRINVPEYKVLPDFWHIQKGIEP